MAPSGFRAVLAALFGLRQQTVGPPKLPTFLAGETESIRRRRRWARKGMGAAGAITISRRGMAKRPKVVRATRQAVELADQTTYLVYSDGSLRHDPRKNPKGQSAVRRHKAERQRQRGLGRVVFDEPVGILARAIGRAKAEREARLARRRDAAA